ncbi:hypothetical protein Lser_V15G16104 [Lactuca serriola]
MAKTRSMTKNQNHDDASTSSRKKRVKTCDNNGATPWSGLNHDVLYLVMMQLGVIDFVALSGVCKSWRSAAHSNRNRFMASRSPMWIQIKDRPYKKELYLQDFEGRKFKTLLPHSADTSFVGLTCGYLILRKNKTRDFWLVNPITRHQLHFPSYPCWANIDPVKAILVFSPSISDWVLVAFHINSYLLWFSRVDKGFWSPVSPVFPMLDAIAFKGNIYTLHTGNRVCEMRLGLNPKLTLLEFKNSPKLGLSLVLQQFVSSDESLYVFDWIIQYDKRFSAHKLDFGEMKWVSVSPEGESVFFLGDMKYGAVIKPESWADSQLLQYRRYAATDQSPKGMFNMDHLWYFPHDCFNDNCIHE